MSKEGKIFKLEEAEFRHIRAAQNAREERLKLELEDSDIRDMSYEPPFSGSRPQKSEDIARVHPRWAGQLKTTPPDGVPIEESGWPVTWGDITDDGRHIHKENGDYCFQCGSCQFYVPIEGNLGADWGACTNPGSQYDRSCVFEHGTCKEFTS